MGDVLERASTETPSARHPVEHDPAVRTEVVNVVFTTADETLAAARVASALAKAMAARLTMVHFRRVSFPLSLEAPAAPSSVEADRFMTRLRSEGIEMGVRVYLCRDEDRAIPIAIKRGSLVVLGGKRSRWPTASERLRRRLEAAGHFVLFVDARARLEASDA